MVVYADASGARRQTSGTTDVEILKKFLSERAYGEVRFRIPKANPAVRDRVTLMNSKLESAAGERSLVVHPRCKELIKDFEQVTYKERYCVSVPYKTTVKVAVCVPAPVCPPAPTDCK